MNNQRGCGRTCKITENWLNIAAFGHMEHYNISNVSSNRIAQDVWMQHISPTTIRAPTNLQTYLKDRLSQVSVQWGYCLFWMMRTTLSITVRIADPSKQNTPLSGNYTTDRRTILHHNGDVCSYHHDTPFKQCISRGIMVGALFGPICQIFPVWFHCTMFRRLCCYRLTIVLENGHSDTLHNISRHKLATVF